MVMVLIILVAMISAPFFLGSKKDLCVTERLLERNNSYVMERLLERNDSYMMGRLLERNDTYINIDEQRRCKQVLILMEEYYQSDN